MNKAAQNTIDVFDVANYFLWRDSQEEYSDGITNLKLNKLAYYAKGVVMGKTGKPLYDEEMRAFRYGPVVTSLYERYKKHERKAIEPPPEGYDPEKIFDSETLETLNEVYSLYGQLSAWRLSQLSHNESPWKKRRHTNGVITDDDLVRHFQPLVH